MKMNDTIRVTINSLSSRLIDKDEAIKMLDDAFKNSCKKCTVKKDLEITLKSLERAIDDEMQRLICIRGGYPLDAMLIEDVLMLHKEKGMILNCINGHVVSMQHESVKDIYKAMEVNYGETKRAACI